MSPDEENSRLNLEVSNAKFYVVSEGYKTPKEVWDPEADLKKAFTNGLTSSLTLTNQTRIKMVMVF